MRSARSTVNRTHPIVDTNGTVTLRWAGNVRHLGIGRRHAGTRVTVLNSGPTAIVTDRTGHIPAEFTLNPARNYQPSD